MRVESIIQQKLQEGLRPEHLTVVNESHMHAVPENSETHFKVVVVSAAFSDLNLVKRHQCVYEILENELQSGVHALALHTYTPMEWVDVKVPDSPDCHSKK